jgi:hypothetical protein
MKIKNLNLKKFTLAIFFVGLMFSAILLGGCSSNFLPADTQNQQKDPITQASDFAISLNSLSSEISQKADDYSKALGTGDTVNAKIAMNSINEALDKVQSLEAPDEIKEGCDKYKNACATLKDALNKVNDVVISSMENPSASVNNASSIASAQEAYDSAIKEVQDADTYLKEKIESLTKSQTQK